MEVIEENFDLSLKTKTTPPGVSHYFGHGKLLLTGEYVVMEGAQALALPTMPGQGMSVRYEKSFNEPVLRWKSLDNKGNEWFSAGFEFWNFDQVEGVKSKESKFLQKLLKQIRIQNKHFLRDEVNVYVETKLGFPREWGLGSSSTLIYNLAQWGYVSPFELLFKTSLGSGYDIACAQSDGPILYKNNDEGPIYSPVVFDPPFKDKLFFVYLGQKQNTLDEIKKFDSSLKNNKEGVVHQITDITNDILKVTCIDKFSALIKEHELILGRYMNRVTLKERLFSDFFGEIKSLGAWGGDFALAVGHSTEKETRKYFQGKGFPVCLRYTDVIAQDQLLKKQLSERTIH
jgi:mevalonate kinase